MKTEQEIRDEFEEWAVVWGYMLNPAEYANDIYKCALTRAAWEAWRAAIQKQSERESELLSQIRELEQRIEEMNE